jgi:hypothetical protein
MHVGRTGAAQVAAFGAQRQHVTLPTGFRSPSENSHSRYGYLTAGFAPDLPFVVAPARGARHADRPA